MLGRGKGGLSMGRYAVAGITGRVGSIVASHLLERGHRVTAIVRDPVRASSWTARGADLVVGSLADPRSVAAALDGADGIFVLLPENDGGEDFHGTRRRMADAVATAVAGTRVPHVVLLSALAAILSEGNGPAKDLHYAERRLERTAAGLTILRPCYFQENVLGALPAARHQGIYPNFLPSADVPVPMIAIRDVGRIAAEELVAPSAPREIVDLLGPPYSIRDVADALGRALGRTLHIVDVPPAEQSAALRAAGVPPQLADAVAEMFAAFASGAIVPGGARRVTGTTRLDAVIASAVPREPAAGALA
jgi:uncharacterized protein YbjT (DUF2867 family)